MSRIYLSAPDVGAAEHEAVSRAMHSGWIAPLGPDVDAFESEIAAATGREHGVALSSGTAALHLGLLGLNVGPGQVVVTSTMTFAATANAITYVGAEPVFVDSDPATGNIDPALLDDALRTLASEGVRVGAIVPVDLLGKIATPEPILALAEQHGVPVLWDAAESLGARVPAGPAGSFGDAAAVSFNGNKIMTTSGGGMFLTDDAERAQRARYLATQARQPVVHYEHTDIGYNYRLSNILAALGRAQLGRLDEMINRRRALRQHYREFFSDIDGVEVLGSPADDAEDNCWLTSIIVDPAVTGWTARELSAWLASADIESRPLWKPMHAQPVFGSARAFTTGASDTLFERGLTLPSGSALGPDEYARIFERIAAFVSGRR